MGAVLALALVVAPAAHAAPRTPFGHAGRWLTDARGRVLIPHGVNVIDKRPPYAPGAPGFGADDARFLRRSGFDAVRLGLIWKALEPRPGRFDDRYLARIRRTARLLGQHGIAVLIDFHQDQLNERFQGEGFPDWAIRDGGLPASPRRGFPGNYTAMPALSRAYESFWDDAPGPHGVGLQEYYLRALRHVARRLRGEREILGYDVFNEPFPGAAQLPHTARWERTKLAAFTRRAFAAIRRVDRRRLLFYEPSLVFDFGATTAIGDLGDRRAAMGFHDYCSPDFNSPPRTGCLANERRPFQNALAQSRRSGDALMLTEFGASDDLADVGRVVRLADRFMMPWTYWAYWNRDPCCARPMEGVIRNPQRPPRGSNVKRAKLRTLAIPHARAVAGTPLRMSFQRSRRRFSLAYSTRRAGHRRRRFGTGARSEIAVPRVQYPRGYRVRVHGARVASRNDAPVLVLAADRGARRVTLVVTARR